MTDASTTEHDRTLARSPVFFERHLDGDRDGILAVIATLERAVKTSNGDLFDSVLGEDVIWGSPKGQIVNGLDHLNPIHRRLAANARSYGYSSRFTLEALGFLDPDTACASVRRTGLDERGAPMTPTPGSIVEELALYMLARRDDRWWIVCAQNTPRM